MPTPRPLAVMRQTVRTLEPNDVAAVTELEAAARAELETQRGGPAFLAERPATADWATVVTSPQERVWVSLIDDVVVGYLQLVVRSQAAEVWQVYVHPEARELGFGDWMLEAALTEARAQGCTVFEGTALPGDRDTKNLYERAGIKARKIIVSTPL